MLCRCCKVFQEFPVLFSYTLGLGVGFGAYITWDQWHWWSRREDYSFGFLVPLFVLVVLWDRWPRLRRLLGAQVEAAPGKASQANPQITAKTERYEVRLTSNWLTEKRYGFAKWVIPTGFYTGLVLGLLIFGLGALYRAGAGPSPPGSLLIAFGGGAAVFALLYICLPHSPLAWQEQIGSELRPSEAMNRRLTATLLFCFPCFIWIISAPLVSLIENRLSLFLLGKVLMVVFFLLEMGGYALEQEGNTLVMPSGKVGIEDACSGIRSLMGCLFAGSFLGAIFLRNLGQKLLLLVFGMAFAFTANLVRSIFLTAWAYSEGPDAISGFVHGVAGYFVLGLTSLMLLALIPILNLQFAQPSKASQ